MKELTTNFKLTYDPEADAAYIYLDEIGPGGVAHTFSCEDLPDAVAGDINLDFDNNGVLKGIEVLNASKVLPPALIKSFA